MVSIGNYCSRVAYEVVTESFGSQSWVVFALPVFMLAGMYMSLLMALGLSQCHANFVRTRVAPV